MKTGTRPLGAAALAAVLTAVLAVLAVAWLDRLPPLPTLQARAPDDAASVARGAVLARAGNCASCHSARGGAPYAGGRAIATPFGSVQAGNLTPHAATGLGAWSADEFWRALHHGRGRDGRRLLPAFPYTEFTRITRADSDALFAFLRTLAPVAQPRRPHTLRWPYGTQAALAVWRTLFFRPGVWQDDPRRSPEWNRGAYLVQGVAHCVACHGGRNVLGATDDAGFGGGLLATGHWYAPSLRHADEAGLADWPLDEIVALLRDGVAPRGRVSGPMAEVVLHGTQHLPAADLHAMAVYLRSLPAATRPRRPATEPPDPARLALGASLYRDHCGDCHGAAGEGGVTPDGRPAVPALAGNRIVTMAPPANLVRAIAHGGFGPATAGNPRPWSMPPYEQRLSDDQIAALASWLRQSWGASAAALRADEVARYRGGE